MRYHPAALALMAQGTTLGPLADAFGVTRTSVSRWLAGEFPAPPGFLECVAALTDRATADHIGALIAEARSARP